MVRGRGREMKRGEQKESRGETRSEASERSIHGEVSFGRGFGCGCGDEAKMP